MIDILLIALLAAMIGAAGRYIYKAKKSGKKCIGCACACSAKQGKTGCHCHEDTHS